MQQTYAFVFPGQGSQAPGMLDGVAHNERLGRLVDAAEALTGLPLRTLAAQGPKEELADTRAAQPLLYLADWTWGVSALDAGISPAALAGHSLGEFAALALAGAFSVEAGLELVAERSRLMAAAAQASPGSMTAVLGLDEAQIADAIAAIPDVWVANDNAPGQMIISGTTAALTRAEDALKQVGARRTLRLAVSGAFHSPLMSSAADEFGDLLDQTDIRDTTLPVIQNVTATPTTLATEIRVNLKAQITAPVRWTETMRTLQTLGVTHIVETGPGTVLKGLAKRVDGLTAFSVSEDDLSSIMEVLAS